MKTLEVDVAIIGAGSAGLNARREVVRAGKSWVMIDGGPLGTTCARVGCMPSKLLIAAADAAHEAKHAHHFGVHIDEGAIDLRTEEIFGRVRAERDRFSGFVVESIDDLDQTRVLRDWARFEDLNTLIVGDHTRVKAGAVVLATGSTPFIPPVFDDIREDVMINDDVFELEEIPTKLAVIGAGVIGLELGQSLGRLGSEVHCYNINDQVGFFNDPVILEHARADLGEEIDFHFSANITKTSKTDAGLQIDWTDADGDHSETFSHVLVAAGRRPNLTGFGLEDLDIPRDERGRPVWLECTTQVGELPLFIAGDASGHRPLLHEASDEGRIAGRNAANFPDIQRSMRRTGLAIAFTTPQMAIVGKGWRELDEDKIAIGEVSYRNQGRARVMLENKGHVRLYADRDSCRLIGGELFGPRVEHTAHLLSWAIQQGMRVPEILRMPFYHPVVEEGIRTALRDLAKKLRVEGNCPPEDFALSPGR